MLDLPLRVEPDASARSANGGAKRNVFHRRPLPLFREASGLEKEIPPDRPAAGPECAGVTASVLMNEGVEQILVLREEVRLPRLKIVRTDHGMDRAVLGQRAHGPGNAALMHANVGIDEQENLSGSRERPDISRT